MKHLIILCAITLISFSSIEAQTNVFKHKFGDDGFVFNSFLHLSLTKEQNEKVQQLKLEHEKKMIDLKSNLEKAKLEKKELLLKKNFSSNDYLKIEEKIMQAENVIKMEKAKYKMSIYNLLTEEQKEKWKETGDDLFLINIPDFSNLEIDLDNMGKKLKKVFKFKKYDSDDEEEKEELKED